MTLLECKLRKKISDSWVGTTPGFHLQVIQNGDLQADLRFGVTYPNYDWASLTKMVLTHTLFMKCVQDGILSIDDPLTKFLPDLTNCSADVKICHLLSHTAGLPGTIGYWKLGSQFDDLKERQSLWRKSVLTLPIFISERSSYSEIDFQIIGYVLESILGNEIASHWNKLSKEMGIHHTQYHENNILNESADLFAPTEICPLRNVRIQGQVHHPDIWLTGGVGWLSGLFGPMNDLAIWAKGLRKSYFDISEWVVSSETLRLFSERVTQDNKGSSSLGYMMPKIGTRSGQKYYLSCGSKLSPLSIGHTGYTGPMFWFDPEKDLIILILANRTFPNAENDSWFDYRGLLHDRIIESIEEITSGEVKIKERECHHEQN